MAAKIHVFNRFLLGVELVKDTVSLHLWKVQLVVGDDV